MAVENTVAFRDKLQRGQVCLGTCITFGDPTVTEALAAALDFVWIDMEHNPLSLSEVQGHLLATKGTGATALVRVPWNDPVLIKPVLDIGAAGVIVPLVRSAEDVRRAVAACKYPPEGMRGYGPRRPSNYGRRGGPDFIRAANDAIITIAQIEHIEAVNNLDDILAVAGLTTIVIGPNDLAGSLGHSGEPRHPEVLRAIDTILAKAQKAGIPVGLGTGGEPSELLDWIKKGVRWLSIGSDFWLLVRAIAQLTEPVRNSTQAK
jgi:2-dehydro-3-deoxyglucarate aldolase/4-hydroxy-2-oxoheptanedioate aldolase